MVRIKDGCQENSSLTQTKTHRKAANFTNLVCVASKQMTRDLSGLTLIKSLRPLYDGVVVYLFVKNE